MNTWSSSPAWESMATRGGLAASTPSGAGSTPVTRSTLDVTENRPRLLGPSRRAPPQRTPSIIFACRSRPSWWASPKPGTGTTMARTPRFTSSTAVAAAR